MQARDYRDILGGAILIVVGGLVAAYALTMLEFGTPRRMGPGMFPTALGVLLVLFGFLVAIPAWARSGGELPQIDLLPLAAILAAILVFGLTLRPFGLVPATILMTVVATRAEKGISWLLTAVLAGSLALIAALIFPIGLGLRMSLFAWPW